jgi:hypothetical protein
VGVKEECVHGLTECENYPHCENTEGCLEVLDYLESRAKRDLCVLAGGSECCEDCRECNRV